MFRKTLLLLLVIVSLAFLHAVRGEFVWDDRMLIVHNRFILRLGGVPYLFTPDYWLHHHMSAGEEYRPVVKVSYALDHVFWGLNAHGFHVTNLTAYLVSVLAVLLLGTELLGSRSLAGFVALLFAVHPSHVECVAYVKNRAEVFSAAFGLLALWLFICDVGGRAGHVHRVAYWVLWAAALLSKKGSLALLAVFALWVWLVAVRERRRRAVWLGAPLLGIWIAHAVFLVVALKPPPYRSGSAISMASAIPSAVSAFLDMLFLPVQSCAHALLGSAPRAALAGTFLVFAFLVLAACSVERSRRQAVFFLLWLAVSAAPSLAGLGSLRPLAEQRMFMPSVAACAVLSMGLVALGRGRARPRVAGVCALWLSMILAALSVERTFVWRDDMTLWRDTVVKSPSNGRAWNNLGNCYAERHSDALAARQFHRSAQIDPRDINPLFNLAQIYERQGQFDLARRTYERLLAIESFGPAQARLGKLAPTRPSVPP